MKKKQIKKGFIKVKKSENDSFEKEILRREKIYEAYLRVFKPDAIKKYDD